MNEKVPNLHDIQLVLTDIEGTTTSLSFVKDTLFPYSRERFPSFVRQHAAEATVRAALSELKAHAGDASMSDDDAIDAALGFIDDDKKLGPLKVLQGLIWEAGYRDGAYQAHLYDDVVPKLEAAKNAGVRLYVYSSGSVFAQKLLFEHTSAGDLTPLFEGYFDTSIGPKKETESYGAILQAVERASENVLFLSDSFEELDAAREAGIVTVGLDRSDLVERGLIGHGHHWIRSFEELDTLG